VAGTVIVDGNNVMGAAADGWWRNRPAAVRRLLARLQCYARTVGDSVAVVLVLDVPQPDLSEGEVDGVVVRYATRRGRDAADDRIRELLDEGVEEPVVVATSDRALAADVRSRGAEVVGARTFLDRLDKAGC
jgi:predicted RNA-binding protein with PIN domain